VLVRDASAAGYFDPQLSHLASCDVKLEIENNRESLSNHDGYAKENVTLKMTSKYVKLLPNSFNSFSLSNGSPTIRELTLDSVTVQIEKKKIHWLVFTFYIKL